jgi:hypothetical protein
MPHFCFYDRCFFEFVLTKPSIILIFNDINKTDKISLKEQKYLISSQEGGSSRDRTPPRKDSLLIEKENEEMDSM